MSDNKKYYYLKLKDNFFDSDEIKILENMPNGYKYSNILLKLNLMSLKFQGALRLNEYIPYNLEMIVALVGHDIDTVRVALDIFERLKLTETLDNGTIYMLNIESLIGKSSTEADRKREFRLKIEDEKEGLAKGTNVRRLSDICPPCKDERPPEIEKEIELEIKKEIKKKIAKTFQSDSDEYRLSVYLWSYIKNNNGQAKEPNMQKWSKDFNSILRLDNRLVEDIKKVIIFSQKNEFWYKNILSPEKLRKHYEKLTVQMQEPRYAKVKSKGQFVENCESRDYDFDDLEKKLLAGKVEVEEMKAGININDY
ncbi:phage replisome organizer N-terminal domain-containing protein [Clostridium sp. CF012]|uniref:phage replisome organizer N-terminal domain-containing protein n=1 Tax=Clostridium sp. CF012 TaxID=2843319 RepID=UPI001C0DF380|nr:phage replisome organizer N-terminal domain-containing protein [Clostridium sp. CF012]MBU3146607.1 phage replisome organizer N-terminal domain-containing protein [Clostridium sp. CF012]